MFEIREGERSQGDEVSFKVPMDTRPTALETRTAWRSTPLRLLRCTYRCT